MSFKELDPLIKPTYNSLKEDIVKNFYIPVLSEAKRYDRITGYFDSSSLAVAARGMEKFILNGGHMRLLCGAKLFPQDVEVIKNAQDAKKIISERFLEDLSNIEDELIKNHVKVLGWMIANNIIEIKVGLNKKNGKYIGGGILHSKIGIFWDVDVGENLDNCVLFNGSVNETGAGWASNFESFDVFKGWKNKEYMMEHINDFPRLWDGDDDNLEVMDIPEADKQALIDKAPSNINDLTRIIKKYHSSNSDDRKLFIHQKNAIDAWFENDKRGILEMATGTGKTFTAINCLKKVFEQEDSLIAIIVCPVLHLIDQWYDDLVKLGFTNIYKFYGTGNPKWKQKMSKFIYRVNKGKIKKSIILSTHSSFSTDFFKRNMIKSNVDLFLIADEMHHLGAENLSLGLLDNYKYRLGLSATPRKFMDYDATEYLMDYFGGIVFTFNLEDALFNINPVTNLSYLTHYMYYPKKVGLNSTESNKYKKLTQQISILLNSENVDEMNLNNKLRERKAILDNANEKYSVLRKILRSYDDLNHLIIFCTNEQLVKVLKILDDEQVKPRHRFTYMEKMSERQYILNKFDEGQYKALVAIKCLNEGVDVPSADKVIIMSSSNNPIEYVQRRGRVLRRYPGKDLAYIYDMVVVPDPDENFADSVIEKELKRLKDFIILSDNKDECNRKLHNWGLLN